MVLVAPQKAFTITNIFCDRAKEKPFFVKSGFLSPQKP